MKEKELIIIGIIMIVVAALGYYIGYSNGAIDTLEVVADHIPEMLDIELTPRAKMVMDSNPNIIRMAFTEASLHKLLSDFNLSANLKGGIGPGWNLYSGLGDISMTPRNLSET